MCSSNKALLDTSAIKLLWNTYRHIQGYIRGNYDLLLTPFARTYLGNPSVRTLVGNLTHDQFFYWKTLSDHWDSIMETPWGDHGFDNTQDYRQDFLTLLQVASSPFEVRFSSMHPRGHYEVYVATSFRRKLWRNHNLKQNLIQVVAEYLYCMHVSWKGVNAYPFLPEVMWWKLTEESGFKTCNYNLLEGIANDIVASRLHGNSCEVKLRVGFKFPYVGFNQPKGELVPLTNVRVKDMPTLEGRGILCVNGSPFAQWEGDWSVSLIHKLRKSFAGVKKPLIFTLK